MIVLSIINFSSFSLATNYGSLVRQDALWTQGTHSKKKKAQCRKVVVFVATIRVKATRKETLTVSFAYK